MPRPEATDTSKPTSVAAEDAARCEGAQLLTRPGTRRTLGGLVLRAKAGMQGLWGSTSVTFWRRTTWTKDKA